MHVQQARSGGVRGRVVQGFFRSRPFSFSAADSRGIQRKEVVQRRPGMDAFQVNLTPKTGGWPLPQDVRAKMESALGANFSDVRIHVGPEASAIGAIAFTWGSDIHFAPGQYNPHTPHGQSLLGHELTHVVQQRAGRVANPFGSGVAVVQDQALEDEADRLGRQAAMSRTPEAGAESSPDTWASLPQGVVGSVINRKTRAVNYAVGAPQPHGSGWQINVAAQGGTQLVASVQLTPRENGVYISDLKVAPEHRRHGVARQLMDAALLTARSHGFPVAQLEARPDSPHGVAPADLISMYRKLGFCTTGISKSGNPLMERRA